MSKLIKYEKRAPDFTVNPEPTHDWLDSFMGGVMTLGVCGSVTLAVLIILNTLLGVLIGAGQ